MSQQDVPDTASGGEVLSIPPIGLRKERSGRYDGQYRPAFSRVHHDADLLWVGPLQVRYIMAVVGERWSGKGAVVSYLQERPGFGAHNLQRVVRQQAELRGTDPASRAVRQRLADTLRAEQLAPGDEVGQDLDGDPAYLARQALRWIRDRYSRRGVRRAEPTQRVVMGGFGHRRELEVLRPLPAFHVLRLVCDRDTRFARGDGMGLLDRDLDGYRQADYPGSQQVDAADRQAVFALVDGYDADGASGAPWAGTCAHGTAALLNYADQWAAQQAGDASSSDPSNAVFSIDTGGRLGDVHARLDEIVRALDHRYLIRTT